MRSAKAQLPAPRAPNFQRVAVSSTMGPGVEVEPGACNENDRAQE